jgi:hypothetical protein
MMFHHPRKASGATTLGTTTNGRHHATKGENSTATLKKLRPSAMLSTSAIIAVRTTYRHAFNAVWVSDACLNNFRPGGKKSNSRSKHASRKPNRFCPEDVLKASF